MPDRDLTELLARGAAGPTGAHDLEEALRQGQRRRRTKRAGAAAAGVAAVVGASVALGLTLRSPAPPVIDQTPAPGADAARLRVEQTVGGGFYTEGSVGHVEVHDTATDTLVVDERLFGVPTVVDAQLSPGRYTLVSFQRPCDGACGVDPQTGDPVGVDPATDRCETTFDVQAGQIVDATIAVTPHQGCSIDLQILSAADAAKAACAVDAVEVAVTTDKASDRAITITTAFHHRGDQACTVRTDLRVAVTDGQGHLLEVDGNPATIQLAEQLAPGQTIRVMADWTSWCQQQPEPTVQVDAASYHGSITQPVSAPDCQPGATSTLRLHEPATDTGPIEPGESRVTATVEGAPPFYLDLGPVHAATDGVWATHTLAVVSEWRSLIGVRLGDVTVRLQRPGQPASVEQVDSTVQILDPEDDTTITVSLEAEPDPPAAGLHTATLEIPFWRDLDTGQPPAGSPDGIATIRLTYEILTRAQLEALDPFCDQVPDALQQATQAWRQDPDQGIAALLNALATTRRSARTLSDPRASRLVEEIDILTDKLERFRDGEQVGHGQHEGFDTHGVVSIINELCDTQINSTGIQA